MRALEIHGLSYCAAALATTGAAAVGFGPSPQASLALLGAAVVALGLPHGALDPVFAQRQFGLRSFSAWGAFALSYLALAGIAWVAWIYAPFWCLAAFLLLSVVHFSGDPAAGTPLPNRILHGGAVIVLPALLHQPEVTRVSAVLVGADAAAGLVGLLHALAAPWLVAAAVAALLRARRDPLGGLELFSTSVLCALAPPLISFTLFFCGMHSLRHALRTVESVRPLPSRVLLTAAGLPMLAVLILVATAWATLAAVPLESRVLRLVFIGLFALTVPHLVVIERVRQAGWLTQRG